MANNQQGNAINNHQQNLMLRQALLQTSPRMTKNLGTFTESSAPEGKTTRIKLFNVGVITKLRLLVIANVTIGTATATVSPQAPFNAIQNISLVDYEGVSRVNCSGYQLWQLQSVRERTPAYLNNEGTTKVNSCPTTPTAVGTADIKFFVEVPVAYDPERDLRGAILGQTAVGDMFLNITWNSDFHRNGNDDGVYNGAATSTVVVNSISVQVNQDYLFPQDVGGGIPLPMMDLQTVYEIAGNLRVTDNLSNGQERLLSYPNRRSVAGIYLNWMNNGAMSDAINQIRLVANGNNYLQEFTLDQIQQEQRKWLNGDLPVGSFFMLSRNRLIETAIYGNVQLGVTFSSAPTGTYYLSQMVESFHLKGMQLGSLSSQG